MKIRSWPASMLLSFALMSLLATPSPAQRDTVVVDTRQGSRVWIEGSSNVHDWSCRAETFDAKVDVDPTAARAESNLAQAIRRVSVKLNARDLKCGNRKMEHDLYNTLRANDPANPSLIIADFQLMPRSVGEKTLATQGTVAVVGMERPVTIEITTEQLTDGTVKAIGAVPLLMTDFGITPPTGLFGLIRSRNEITVKFDLVVSRRGMVALETR